MQFIRLTDHLRARNLERMRRHTTLDLDVDLIREAAAVLGTRRPGETVNAALTEVIRARKRARLLELSTDLTLDDLRAMRITRFSPPES